MRSIQFQAGLYYVKVIIGTILTFGLFIDGFSQNDPTLNVDPVDETLLSVAGEPISKSEFISVYKKNNRDENPMDRTALEEYIELYINFKLKVAEAKELGLDTSKEFISELAGYRKQLAQPYLTDKEINIELLEEAYQRKLKDIRASHILIKLNAGAEPKDTLAAYKKAMNLRRRILKGEDFDNVARLASEDPSARENGGDLGYFSVFQMIYPFETMAYNTQAGKVSKPVRTRYGYHIIKVNDVREALGEVKVAHIMLITKNGASKEELDAKKTLIDEVYGKLNGKSDFANLASEYSEDKGSAKKGGALPWFTVGKMVGEFDQATFELKNIGDFSKPVKTTFGWHIIKLLDKRPVPGFDQIKIELEKRIAKDSRSSKLSDSFVGKIKLEYGFKEYLKERNDFYKKVDDSYFQGKWQASLCKELGNTLFTLDSKNYGQQEFAAYIERKSRKKRKEPILLEVNKLYADYVKESCMAYEDSRLVEKYPDFKSLLQEYHDGILLFELTDQKVWSKAISDTTGLRKFHIINSNKYMWDTRLDVSIYSCKDEAAAKSVRKLVKKGLKKGSSKEDILTLANQEGSIVEIEEGKFLKEESPLAGQIEWINGFSKNVNIDNQVVFAYVNEVLAPMPKTLKEAKGLVTADYQNYLEKEWIEVLRKKYDYHINKDVLDTLENN